MSAFVAKKEAALVDVGHMMVSSTFFRVRVSAEVAWKICLVRWSRFHLNEFLGYLRHRTIWFLRKKISWNDKIVRKWLN